jgi:hypothetical protein
VIILFIITDGSQPNAVDIPFTMFAGAHDSTPDNIPSSFRLSGMEFYLIGHECGVFFGTIKVSYHISTNPLSVIGYFLEFLCAVRFFASLRRKDNYSEMKSVGLSPLTRLRLLTYSSFYQELSFRKVV